jgi:glycosyltransferase involved in cell wall biosynthesis
MKILHVIDSEGLYGAEVMLLSLVAEQVKLGLEPTIASIGEKGIGEKKLETEALKRCFAVRKFRMRAGPNAFGAFEVLRFAREGKFDLIHSHGYKGNILFGFMPRSIRGLPLVSTVHGYTSTQGVSKMRMYEWLDACSLKFIDRVVVVNKGMLENPRLKKVRGVKFHVVNNGIPMDSPPVAAAKELERLDALDKTIVGFCKRGFTVGSVGRLSEEKGYKYLIEAVRKLGMEGVDARLLILGEGPQRSELERLVGEFGIGDRVLLPGYRNDAKRYIHLMAVFVISSLTEGLPMSLLEAMQAGVPIVATRVGGIPDVMADGEAGVLVQPRNPNALAEAIEKIKKDEGLNARLTARARRLLEDRYSSKKMALEYCDLYGKVLSTC